MNKGDYKNILADDWREKKKFDAHFDTKCSVCGYDIYKDDKFVFFGKSEKLCIDCYEEVRDFIEEGFISNLKIE